MGLRRILRALGRQRLVKCALRHTGGAEHHLLHELGERFAHDVDEHLLDDGRTAAGVTDRLARRDIDTNGRRVGRTAAVEDLLQGRHGVPGFVAREAGHRGPAGVAQKHPQRHRRGASELVLGELPRLQIRVDRRVEIQGPGFCTNRCTTVAVIGLLIEAAWNSVSVSAIRPVARSATP